MQKLQGIAEQGGANIVTSGTTATTESVITYPSCTVTVYEAGTTNLASIFSDNGVTPKANPFTASAIDASWFFHALSGEYDVRFSGTGINTPYTISGLVIAEPNEDIFSVKIYGAIGDGTTDDTIAIQATLDAVAASDAGSGTIYFPTGTYLVTATLNVDSSDTKILGGANAVITTTLNGIVFDVSSVDNIEFNGLHFIGNFTGSFNNQHAVTANPAGDDLNIHDCIFESVVGPIFVGGNGERFTIKDNLFLLNGADIQFGSGIRTTINILHNRFTGAVTLHRDDLIALSGCNNDVIIDGNWADCNGSFASGLLHGEGVLLESSEVGQTPKKIKIINNTFKNMPSGHALGSFIAGINVGTNGGIDAEDVVIKNNTLENMNAGIFIQATGAGLIIQSNTIRTTTVGYNAINLTGAAPNVLIANNNVYSSGNHGISVSNPVRPRILGNFISAPLVQGIFVNGTNPNICNNTILSATFDAIQCVSADPIIANNQILSSGRYGINLQGSAASANPYIVANKIIGSGTAPTLDYSNIASNLRGSRVFAGAATTVVAFATAEPDTSYYITITGNANETFWVSAKTVNGFTINSSNATSNAGVEWHLLR